jgi:uncharacterized RDD family membrane protein YckC
VNELTITTPEHVPIRLEPAGAGSRMLAALIDFSVTSAAAIVAGVLTAQLAGRGVAQAVSITAGFVFPIAWHLWFETRGHGRTPGKRALSLRVIDARGLPVSLHQSLARNVVRTLDFLPLFYGVAAIVSLFDGQRRRLGDVVAGTLVIREAQPLAYQPHLAAARRHNSLRTPRVVRMIRHRISLEERELLLTLCLRAEKMQPSARYDLMEHVAAVYRRRLGIEDEQISGENLVRDLTAVIFEPRELAPSAGRSAALR